MNLIAFLSYVVILAFTPGPNNLMALEESKRLGFKRSFPFMEGLLAGFLVLAIITLVFTDRLMTYIPSFEPYMKIVGSFYIFYLIWGLFRKSSEKESTNQSNRQLFISGLILNLSNVKVMLYFLTGYIAFILPAYENIWIALLLGLFLCFAGTCSNLLWASFGSLFKNFFNHYERAVTIAMAALLFYSVIEIWS
ncbi:LysE family transporter [Sporolactobacillus shoreicorticis]|uniref:LysE family translocator n=1 Tax=Sporolactobacillus shoreicorticis TaxID=1923877 RepID=A0ABW5S1P8_9BACL|nr:LysE family transporter [Sporolactobacillus shoreicorticis]MCO7124572.1 LysE family transporter [Sporolactobacillus shoreicorticis]